MKAEKVLADAEIAACYLRALLDKGVPMIAAVQLTSSYCSALLISEKGDDKPKPPWETSE